MKRREAEELGLHRYVGVPCRKNHSGWRYTKSGECVTCHRDYSRKSRQKKEQELREGRRGYMFYINRDDLPMLRAVADSLNEARKKK